MDKVKPIIIHDKQYDKDYTIEFSREAVKFAESRKFNIKEVDIFPMTKVPELIWYGMMMHHPKVTLKQVEDLVERMGGVNAISKAAGQRLGELWATPYGTLADEEGDEKNAEVTVEL